MMKRLVMQLAMCVAIALVVPARAQNEIPSRITVQNRTGDLPFSTTIGTSIEHVDAATGALNIEIPLWSVAGRGMTHDLSFLWSSNYYYTATHFNVQGPYPVWTIQGNSLWRTNQAALKYSTKSVTCDTDNKHVSWRLGYLYTDIHGSNHMFGAQKLIDGTGWCKSSTVLPGSDMTAQGMSLTVDEAVKHADGTQYKLGNYEDSNGNMWSAGGDSLGRTMYTTTNLDNPSRTLYTYTDPNGTSRSVTVYWTTTPINTHFNAQDKDFGSGIIEMTGGGLTVASSIVLPNGQTYTFHYDDCDGNGYCYGEITKIDLPNGGHISYTWGTLNNDAYTRRYVTSRTEDPAGAPASTWYFTVVPGIDGIGSQTLSTTVTYPGSSGQFSAVYASLAGSVTDAQIYSSTNTSGTPLREYSILYNYDGDPNNDPVCYSTPNPQDPMPTNMRPTRIITVLENGSTATKKEFDYETFTYTFYPNHCTNGTDSQRATTFTGSRGNVTAIREYAWGTAAGSKGHYTDANATLLRSTSRTYLHTNNANYLAANIVNKVLSETVTDNQLGSQQQTQYEYDSTAITSTGNSAASHDSAYSSSYTIRGNVTRVKKWLSGGTFLTTTYGYDDLGNIRSVTDPNSNTTTYSYADSFGNGACPPVGGSAQAYVTQITNALSQNTQLSYYSCTGLVLSSKDQNDINASRAGTTYAYDLMKRPVSIGHPDGGSASSSYYDGVPATATTTSVVDQNSGTVTTSISVKDGLGRTATLQESDPDCSGGMHYTTMQYDPITGSDLTKRSTPYCTNDTPVYTTFLYDSLSRPTQTTETDGSHASVSYSLNTSTATDEANNTRRSTTDALGRLILVEEPDPASGSLSSAYPTSYTYDAFGNLKSVTQKGNAGSNSSLWRTRTFQYDAVSRLLSAQNPESGTITYAYDSDSHCSGTYWGDLVSKTDNRQVRTCFTYDQLHRVLLKSYTDGVTPATSYIYDSTTLWGVSLSNTIGRLTNASISSSSPVGYIYSYDPMGREVEQFECTPTSCGTTTYHMAALYNYLGDRKQITYPSGQVVTFDYINTAHRLRSATVIRKGGQPQNFSYITNITYFPNGMEKLINYGNGISESNLQNTQMQLQQSTIRGAAGTFMDHAYTYGPSMQNNGNISIIADQLSSAKTQNFSYDHLNRITAASEAGSAGWGQAFTVDAWGNLTNETATKGNPPIFNATVSTSSNKFDGYSYDNAGNMLTGSYAYDAESRITTVGPSQSPSAKYIYDGLGQRAYKWVNGIVNEYMYFGSESYSERHNDGTWTDYIYGNGRRLVRSDGYHDRILFTGTNTCGQPSCQFWSIATMPVPQDLAGYTIQSGDKLYLIQFQTMSGLTSVYGGMYLTFSDSSTTKGLALDQDGQLLNHDTLGQNYWHNRRVDLSQFAGKAISGISLISDVGTPSGTWNIYYEEISVVSADGTVHTIYSWQPGLVLSTSSSQYVYSISAATQHALECGCNPQGFATYYHGDQLGSSRMTSGLGGYPTWQATYLPYGYEYNPHFTVTTYKFTGKERDSETALDYFGARYYSDVMARFMTPDWALKPIAVPYANFGNPQSLNLYSYVGNNPETLVDTDGHEIIYADNLKNAQLVKDSVQAILANPHTSGNLSGYVGPNNPNLTIQSGDLSAGDTKTVLPSGQTLTTTVQGQTAPDIQTSTVTSNGVTSAPETILTGATITIDNRTSNGDTPGVLVHESVHAGEAQADPAKFLKDAAAEKSLPHDQRPQEQRANAARQAFGNEIKKEVKQIEKDRKKDNQ